MTTVTKRFYAWITTARPTFVDQLIVRLVKKEYTVGPLGRHIVVERDEADVAVVAITLYRIPNDDDEAKLYNAGGVYSDIERALTGAGAKFFSIVVTEGGDATWNFGNTGLREEIAVKKQAVN